MVRPGLLLDDPRLQRRAGPRPGTDTVEDVPVDGSGTGLAPARGTAAHRDGTGEQAGFLVLLLADPRPPGSRSCWPWSCCSAPGSRPWCRCPSTAPTSAQRLTRREWGLRTAAFLVAGCLFRASPPPSALSWCAVGRRTWARWLGIGLMLASVALTAAQLVPAARLRFDVADVLAGTRFLRDPDVAASAAGPAVMTGRRAVSDLGVAITVAVVVLGPVLFPRRGFALRGDMVFVPATMEGRLARARRRQARLVRGRGREDSSLGPSPAKWCRSVCSWHRAPGGAGAGLLVRRFPPAGPPRSSSSLEPLGGRTPAHRPVGGRRRLRAPCRGWSLAAARVRDRTRGRGRCAGWVRPRCGRHRRPRVVL